jgi:DNA helicase II / ATP-dependent DNA helicase PcrA
MSFDPTPEQQSIIDAARLTKDNLVIEALAGAAKTTTLTMIAKALPNVPILAIAFNKRIAEEMVKRLPGNATSKTLNAVGHRAWADQIRKKLILDKDKTYGNFKAETDRLKDSKQFEERSRLFEQQGDILKAVRHAKTWGWVPEQIQGSKTLISDDEFFDRLNQTLDDDFSRGLITDLVVKGIQQAFNGQIDFDDQIYMPTLFGGQWPKFPLVMIDEAQDLSPSNHAMLGKLVTQRLIAVGDPYQSIYGFRGAQSDSMAALTRQYNMTRLGLSVSFRCPKAVIEKARSRAPHMQWPEWAIDGEVNMLESWDAASIPDHAAIICRNNAPLLHMALELLKNGRGAQLVGMDLGPQLVKMLKKMGDPSLPREQVFAKIEEWKNERLKKGKNISSITDKAECLTIFADFGETLGGAIAYAEHIFSAHGLIQLLSGHKSKGLEWDTVYHLDPWRIPGKFANSDEEKEQEANVRYVIETRPKRVLNLVTTEGFVSTATAE